MTAFTCDICGDSEGGRDRGPEELGMDYCGPHFFHEECGKAPKVHEMGDLDLIKSHLFQLRKDLAWMESDLVETDEEFKDVSYELEPEYAYDTLEYKARKWFVGDSYYGRGIRVSRIGLYKKRIPIVEVVVRGDSIDFNLLAELEGFPAAEYDFDQYAKKVRNYYNDMEGTVMQSECPICNLSEIRHANVLSYLLKACGRTQADVESEIRERFEDVVALDAFLKG